jgi:sn-glycerol 3-phosphate transport system ATP-binding protein
MAILRLENVTKTYPNGFKAIHGIDLDVADGEFIVLVGPFGCGKSTLLRMIAGLEGCATGAHPGTRSTRGSARRPRSWS